MTDELRYQALDSKTSPSCGNALAELLKPDRLTTIVDIGASPFDGDPPYKSMLESRLCRVIGFEPQPVALDALNARKGDLERYLPYAIGDGTKAQLRICRGAGFSSLLAPDPSMLSHFRNFSEWGQVVQEVPVVTRRLDDVQEVDSCDFLKIDVQGSEISVLKNGQRRLSASIAVQTEVSFICLYKEQAPFGEIDLELRRLGFVPHALVAVKKLMLAPLFVADNPNAAMNQLLEADILYVRDFTRPEKMDVEQLKHLALVAHHCYKSFDLAMNCIHRLVRIGALSAGATDQYIQILRGVVG
jgi:FkbM family methyltransferase